MSEKPKAYRKNVEGDFYVEDGCCIDLVIEDDEQHSPARIAGYRDYRISAR